MLQPAVKAYATALEQLCIDAVEQIAEPIRKACGRIAKGVPDISQVAVLDAVEADVAHIDSIMVAPLCARKSAQLEAGAGFSRRRRV